MQHFMKPIRFHIPQLNERKHICSVEWAEQSGAFKTISIPKILDLHFRLHLTNLTTQKAFILSLDTNT